MTIELTPQDFLAHADALSITEEELVDELTWPYSAEAAPTAPEPREPERSLTVTWEDPLVGLPLRRRMSGREYLDRIVRGQIPPPPIAKLLEIDVVEIGDGRATFEGTPGEQHYNPIGVVHGGYVTTLLDSAMGCAVETLQSAGTGYTTLELKVNFTRPLTVDTGRVLAEGVVVHAGSRVATAEARLFSARTGKLLAHGTSTLLILGDSAH
jgi:uncharacterized protein (TIGR00369 family)